MKREGFAGWVALFVLVTSLSPFTGVCRAGSSPGVPVVLLGEPKAGKDSDPWEESGFLSRLQGVGYEAGKTLFVFEPPGLFEDFTDATACVAGYLNEVLALTGSEGVHVVAYGITGLIARLALEAGMVSEGRVENLVMVGSPNRGTFVACLVKSLIEAARHEAIMELENRAGRYSPVDWDELISMFGKKGTTDAQEESVIDSGGPVVWKGELQWIKDRSVNLYEPLYARYVLERFFSVPYVPVQSPKETFAGWICRTQPQLWLTLTSRGSLPPLKRDETFDAGLARMPKEGEDLTLGYYELLAMEVARNRYVMGMAANVSLAKSLFEEPYVPTDWKDALVHYGEKVLKHFIGKALLTLKAQAQVALCKRVVRWTGLSNDPDSPFLRRLISEELLVNLGSSRAVRFARLPANHYLASLNARSQAQGYSRSTRYVSLVGKTTNFWKVAFPWIGPNDLFTEVDCAVSPLGPKDLAVVFDKVSWSARGFLLKDKRVQDYIVKGLSASGFEGTPCPVADSSSSLTVSSWAPVYALSKEPGGPACLTLHLSDPPAGWCYGVWFEDTTGCPKDVEFLENGGRCSSTVEKWGDGVRVGIRLFRTGAMNPYAAGGTVDSAFAKEAVCNLVCTASSPVPASPEPPGDTWGGSQVLPKDDLFTPIADWPGDGFADDDGLPLVRVVYRTKRTTLKTPSVTCHEYWLLDFGDGSTCVIQGEPYLSTSHVYKRGTYKAVATSYDGDGKEIFKRTWALNPGTDGSVEVFKCTSVAQPSVEVLLHGPEKWISGQPACFSVHVLMDIPEEAEVERVTFDPGQQFKVLWERSGEFSVSAAATLRIRYHLEGKSVLVTNTYLATVPVTVLTTGITR